MVWQSTQLAASFWPASPRGGLRRAFRQGGLVGLLVVVAQAATALGFLKGWAGARGSDAVSRGDRPASGGNEP